MFGLSRNTLFAIGGVMLAIVLWIGFSGDDEAEDAAAKTGQNKKGGKKHRGKSRTSGSEGGMGVGKMCVKLDCTPEQLAELKALVKDYRKQTSGDRRALKEAYALLATEYAAEELDEAGLDDAFDAVSEHRATLDGQARLVLDRLHGSLTDEQREGLARLVAAHGPTQLLARPAHGSDSGWKSGKKRRRKGKKSKRSGGPGGVLGPMRKPTNSTAPVGRPGASPSRALDPAVPGPGPGPGKQRAPAVPELDAPPDNPVEDDPRAEPKVPDPPPPA